MVGVKVSDILQSLPLTHGFLTANDYGVRQISRETLRSKGLGVFFAFRLD